ncbi:MAG: hypothetical protein ACLFMO_06215 [Eubacteriales bacterium]
MKKHINLIIAFMIIISIVGCGKKEALEDNLDDNFPDDFHGEITNNIYKNEFFGLELSIPNEWYIVEQEDLENFVLFQADKYEESEDVNPYVRFTAEKIDDSITLDYYIEKIENELMQYKDLTIEKDTEIIKGKEYNTVKAILEHEVDTVYLEIYVTLNNEYVTTIEVCYSEQEGKKDIKEIEFK